ncbi:MAG: hypothetical protein ABII89_01860 [Candidatus Omnitrophota bacterium]
MSVLTIVFKELPLHDTCWSLITGVDGNIYIGICGEMTGGLSGYIASYNPKTEETEYLLEVAKALGVPSNNGQASHAKIHYSLVTDKEGILYAATHCTGAPAGDFIWRPWNCWTHPIKNFSGSGLVVYDPRKKETLFTDFLLPNEGTRCMTLACKRKKLYGISYPRDHFFTYDLRRRKLRDLGRIGSINPQAIFLDPEENGYTTDDYGNIIKYDAGKEQLQDIDVQIPHASFRNGFHNVPYDVTPSLDGESVYGVTWAFGERLFRYEFKKKKIYDFGKACGEESEEWSHIIKSHTGGLVFGDDGNLYFVSNLVLRGKSSPHLIRFNPETLKREIVEEITCQGKPADHISRATFDSFGNLYFAEVGNKPTKIFKFEGAKTADTTKRVFRHWG